MRNISKSQLMKQSEEGIDLSDFKKIDFQTSQFPDFYYVLVYVLFGQGALDYALSLLKIPYFKVNETVQQDTKYQKIKLKLQKSPDLTVNIEKDAILKKKAIKKIKQTYPFRTFPTYIKKQLYKKVVILTSELLDYNYFYFRLLITQSSFVRNSSVLFGKHAPIFATSLFFQIVEQDKYPGLEELEFPTLIHYFYQKFFRKNLFPQVRNIEAFNLYDINKDGRITSEDLRVIESSGEPNIEPRLRVELMRVKQALTDIMFAPKGFRNPYIDQVKFNKATYSQSALFPLIQEQILKLQEQELRGKDLILYNQMQEQNEEKESSHSSKESDETESSADIAISYFPSAHTSERRQLIPELRYK